MTDLNFKDDVEAIQAFVEKYANLRKEIAKVIVGQDEVIKNILMVMFSRSHALLIGVPGLAKTLMITTIAKTINLSYNRIQFTPDLMPSDIIGSEILGEDRQFKFIKGPIFANFILADEINRTPPKTQAALLEAMQERSVTASGTIYKLDEPFFVMATQNPIEQEGTYPLPEAQLDRFMFNINVGYPSLDDEIRIVKNTTADKNFEIKQILSAEEIIYFQNLIRKIPINDNVLEYAVRLVNKTRPDSEIAPEITRKFIHWGAGPRASQYLVIGAKTVAVLNGKYSPDIEDVQAVAKIVLRHRVVKNYKAEAEGLSIEDIIDELVKD